jgi:hypothetical protein
LWPRIIIIIDEEEKDDDDEEDDDDDDEEVTVEMDDIDLNSFLISFPFSTDDSSRL